MDLFTIFLIAVGLSMDAFAAAVARGVCLKQFKLKYAAIVAVYLAFFQGAMLLLGWLLGKQFNDILDQFSHWVIFIVLALIGVKLIYDARKGMDESNVECTTKANPLSTTIMLTLALATSVDAFAVGVSFALFPFSIWLAILIVASVTFVLSFIAVYLGKLLGDILQSKAELFGGLILIAIAIKILIEGLTN
jgi:putative Mn2+ efflux pump MntP